MRTENPDHYDVAVIGAGPAGLFCAIHASAQNVRFLLMEKNDHPGKKLLLSGIGQCNITHNGEIRDFLSHYGDHGKQLKPALLGFSNSDLIRFFSQRGLSMLAEDNGKIFPQTRCAADVLAVLMRECREKEDDEETRPEDETPPEQTFPPPIVTEPPKPAEYTFSWEYPNWLIHMAQWRGY